MAHGLARPHALAKSPELRQTGLIHTRNRMHIVDELIHERAPKLVHSPFWPLLRPPLYTLLGYPKAVSMADAIRGLGGLDALDYISRLLSLEVSARHLDRVPEKGRCLVVCNHPTGIADGIAVRDALMRRRNDLVFFANADALRVNPRFAETLIPVEWVETKRTRDKTRLTLEAAKAAFQSDACVVMFPAGRLARRDARNRLTDPAWAGTCISLAQKYSAPVVPVHLSGPDSVWFHLFNRFSKELRDITLFHEFLNKAGGRFDLTIGPAIAADMPCLDAARLKTYVERTLSQHPDASYHG